MISWSIAGALSCVLAALLMVRQRQRVHAPEVSVALAYQRRASLLAADERVFFEELQRLLGPNARIFPKVSLSELVDVPAQVPDRRTIVRRLRGRCVDFVVCSPSTLAPMLVVEVEDRDPRRRRRGSGGLLNEVSILAGLPVIRVYGREPSRAKDLALKIRIALGTQPRGGASPAPAARPWPSAGPAA